MNSPSKKWVVVDTETKPDLELLGSEYKPGKFNIPLYHEIVSLSMSVLSTEKVGHETVYVTQSLGTAGGSERENLQTFADYLEGLNFTLVGYNSLSFDIQVLVHRALKHGVGLPALYLTGGKFDNPMKRYSDVYHIDLCDTLANYGASNKVSLDKLAKAVGLPGKMGVDGSQVEEMCAQGRLQDVRNYCELDVSQTVGLFLRFQRLRGFLSGEGFLLSTQNYLNFLKEKSEQKPHLREFLDKVDLAHFLNAGPSLLEEAEVTDPKELHDQTIQDNSPVKLKLVQDI